MVGIKKFLGKLSVAAVAFPPVLVPGVAADRPPIQWRAYRTPVRFEALSIEQGLSQSSVVAFRRIGDGPYELVVRDNGVGLPAGFGLETSESLGLQIVRARYDMPVVFMSALTDPETRGRAASIGRP